MKLNAKSNLIPSFLSCYVRLDLVINQIACQCQLRFTLPFVFYDASSKKPVKL